MYIARLRGGGPKTNNQKTKSRFYQKDPGQAEKQISKYNAKLINYSPQATKFLLQGVFGAPEGGFGGEGAVFISLALYVFMYDCFSASPGSF